MSDERALAFALFGTDDTELMTTQQLLDYKAIQAALRAARAEGLEEAANVAEETSAWRKPYAHDIGHRERLSECELICAAIRAKAEAGKGEA